MRARRVGVALVLGLLVTLVSACTSTPEQPVEADRIDRPAPPVAYALVGTVNSLNASLRVSPLEASRIMAYTMMAAWAAYGNDEGINRDHAAVVAGSEVAARLMQEPTRALEARNLVKVYGADRDAEAVAYGMQLAEGVLLQAAAVGYESSMMPWSPAGSSTGMPWEPTGHGRPGLEPGWGSLRPIITESNSCTLPDPDPEQIKIQARQLLENFDRRAALGNDVMWWLSGTGTATPAGQWLRIVVNVAQQQTIEPADALQMLTTAAVAANDAAIMGWREKYRHNVARPETVWRVLGTGKPLPVLPRDTPPHPSYPSGHSFFGAAVTASVLPYLGDVPAFDQLPADLYVPAERRDWPSLTAALAEAGQSRVNAGFHFPEDVIAGTRLGNCVAEAVTGQLNAVVSGLRNEASR
jgi:membrane-associated phospholipid phosphatase